MLYRKIASTRDMPQDEWLNLRRKGIGGSDAGAIAGLNPYSSAYSVYWDKLGKGPEKEVSEAMRIGTDLEEYVAKRFTEQTGKKVRVCKYVLQNIEHEFMIADIDRMVVGENAILECKTTLNRDGYTFEGNDYPAYWYCQCLHYIAVTGADRVYLAVLVFGKGLFIITIEKSNEQSDIDGLIEIEKRFWQDHVLAEIPPAIDGTDRSGEIIAAQYPAADDSLPTVDLMGYAEQLQRLEQIKTEIGDLEEEKSGIENMIKEVLGNASAGEYGGYRVTWKNRDSTRLDARALKSEMPDVYAKFSKTTSSRTFLFKSEKN